MKRIYLWIFLLFASGNLFAQNNIVQYEYWLDNAYTAKVTTNISPVQTYNWQTSIPCQNLEVGLHVLNVRFKDQYGQWSATESRYFQKLPDLSQNKLVAYEYWLNDRYDEKQTGAISRQTNFVILSDFDIRKAIKATNAIHFRFKDELGQWSSVLSSEFCRPVEPDFTSIVGLSEVTFTNTSKYADKYEWDFGDGNTSEQVNPIHTYAEPGAYQVKLIAHNKEFTDSLIHYVEIEGIKSISNHKGGNNGLASFDIYGGNLDATAVVKLVKNGETISTYSVYKREPGVICATFDLTGKNIGIYDIVITANGKDYSLQNEFEIEGLDWYSAWTELEGNNVFIPGRWQTYTVHYGNYGNSDIYGLPVNLIFSNVADVEFSFDLIDTAGGESTDIQNSDNFIELTSLYSEPFNGRMYSVLIPHIPANTSGSFTFRMKIDTSVQTKIYVTEGEVLNDVYFNIQEDNIKSDEIFGYYLTDRFYIKKETLSQLIRNEINKSFESPQTSFKKRLVNFTKLLDTSNCLSTLLRGNTRHCVYEPGSTCMDQCTNWSLPYNGVQFRYCHSYYPASKTWSSFSDRLQFNNTNSDIVEITYHLKDAKGNYVKRMGPTISKPIGNNNDKNPIDFISVKIIK